MLEKDPVLEVLRKEQWDHTWFGEQACGEFVCNTHLVHEVCLSLGAPRKIEVEGRMIKMHHGDCLPLFGEEPRS